MKEGYSEILQEDNFSFKMILTDEVKKVVLILSSKKIFPVCCHPCKYPKINHTGSFEVSHKHCQ